MDEVIDRAAVRVGGVEIPAAAIAAEAQNHPAPDAATAWTEAAEALAIRQLLLAEAERLAIDPGERLDAQGRPLAADDAKIDALLEREVRVPEATAVEARRFYDRHRERSEERRGGKECVGTCRSGWSRYNENKKKNKKIKDEGE